MKAIKFFKFILFVVLLLFFVMACELLSPPTQSEDKPFTVQITNSDSFPEDGVLLIALCENKAGALDSGEALLSVQAIKNDRWDPSSMVGAEPYDWYLAKYPGTEDDVVSYYSNDKEAAKAGISDARVQINDWSLQKNPTTSSGCPILNLTAFVQSGDWISIGMCPFEKIIVTGWYQGEKIDQTSSQCNLSSDKPAPPSQAALVVDGTSVIRTEVIGYDNLDTLTWHVEKDGQTVLDRGAANETKFNLNEVFSEPGEYTVVLHIYDGEKGNGKYIPISNTVIVVIEQAVNPGGGLTNPNCSWADKILGTWTYDGTSYLVFAPGGVGYHYSIDSDGNKYYLDSNGNKVIGEETWGWDCLENDFWKNKDSGTQLPISFPDNDHYILNGDRWNRVR